MTEYGKGAEFECEWEEGQMLQHDCRTCVSFEHTYCDSLDSDICCRGESSAAHRAEES